MENYRISPVDLDGNSDIEIVDYDGTGRVTGGQWQAGMYQFLQAKHGLKITPEALTAASLSHPTFFSLYHLIIGLTGTMGEAVEREEVQKIYNVDSFDVPQHFPCLRKKIPGCIAITNEEQYEILLKNIQEMQRAGRPALLLFKTIKESETFSQFLHKKSIQHQLINENQRENEDYLVVRTGDAARITIATNVATRGTDILLSPESKAVGGLCVIFTFYPNNLRVEEQGFGRAGRQGQLGDCGMILNIQDELIQSLIKSFTIDSNQGFSQKIDV